MGRFVHVYSPQQKGSARVRSNEMINHQYTFFFFVGCRPTDLDWSGMGRRPAAEDLYPFLALGVSFQNIGTHSRAFSEKGTHF